MRLSVCVAACSCVIEGDMLPKRVSSVAQRVTVMYKTRTQVEINTTVLLCALGCTSSYKFTHLTIATTRSLAQIIRLTTYQVLPSPPLVTATYTAPHAHHSIQYTHRRNRAARHRAKSFHDLTHFTRFQLYASSQHEGGPQMRRGVAVVGFRENGVVLIVEGLHCPSAPRDKHLHTRAGTRVKTRLTQLHLKTSKPTCALSR